MLKNFFKIAFRNLWRSKAFSAINIAGLSIGMAAAILILLWVQNELSTDRFYKNTDRLYLMFNRDKFDGEWNIWGSTPSIMAPALKQEFPEVEDAARIYNITFLVSAGEKRFMQRGAFTDSSFLTMFDLPLAEGNARQVLTDPHSMVITQGLAKKLFGSSDAVGKTVRIDSTDNFTVAGVLKDLPANTGFEFDYLLPWAYLKKLGWERKEWGDNEVNTYALLKPNVSGAAFNSRVQNITRKHSDETPEVFAHSIGRLHLYSKSVNGQLVAGRIDTVRLFIVIAIFILLIACINFMNLSTARSERRAKEVGIRKVVGAWRSSLLLQFIGESILFSLLAFSIALFIVQVSLASFNGLVGKQLLIDWARPQYWLFAVAFIVGTGILAGSYPAFYLSSFRPVKVLKGTFIKRDALITPRKVLVVLQFSFAIILIISTLIIWRQIQYAKDRESGYNRNNLVFTFTNGDVNSHYAAIRSELLASGAVLSVTRAANPITRRWSGGWGYHWNGSTEGDQKIQFVQMSTDADFVRTTGVTLLQGRDIDINKYPSDSNAVLLNEAAVEAMHAKNPLGMIISRDGEPNRQVVGVIKNFVLESPYDSKINPILISGPLRHLQVMHYRLNPAHATANNLDKVGKIFARYNPLYPFEYVFTDEAYAKKFGQEQREGKLAALFAILTIFISCLGLFGLASYMAEARIREIGVRKVLGASAGSIAALLSKDFIRLVFIAILIASPIAWWAMNSWLTGFSYRIHVSVWMFAGAGALAILIALLTVSWQALKAARSNPVQSLRAQ
ncbi:MAG: ABC transporter permease [Bacteroidetes bacterium]|nr:ABC transporter permease [Bacteroidota bacterium]